MAQITNTFPLDGAVLGPGARGCVLCIWLAGRQRESEHRAAPAAAMFPCVELSPNVTLTTKDRNAVCPGRRANRSGEQQAGLWCR